MSDSVTELMYLFYVAGLVLALCLAAYAAYWSFDLRRALKVRAYSRQMLLVGSFTIYGVVLLALFYLVYFIAPNLQNSPILGFQSALYIFLPPIIFAWLDSSLRVGRRSDPLLRDSFRWSKLRMVLWPLLLLSLIGYLVQGNLSVIGLLSYVILAVSVVPLIVTARRSGDRYYRRSLEWFGVALAAIVTQNIGFATLVQGLGTGIVYSPSGFIWAILANFVDVPIVFYGAYLCARSLVPLNRISLES